MGIFLWSDTLGLNVELYIYTPSLSAMLACNHQRALENNLVLSPFLQCEKVLFILTLYTVIVFNNILNFLLYFIICLHFYVYITVLYVLIMLF